MTFQVFLNRVIDDGIEACRTSYRNDKLKCDGAEAGFEVCRGKNVMELKDLLDAAGRQREAAFRGQRHDYWYFACYRAEIEWVCNVVSAALQNQDEPYIVPPTARGFMKAAEILGVRAEPFQFTDN